MKSKLFLLAVLLACATARADTITLNDTQCGTLAQCANPAPNVSSLNYSVLHERLRVTINGVTYDSGVGNATLDGGTVYAPDGSHHLVETVFATWRTCNHSGRGQGCETHYELKGGTVE